ncbi:MAG TPA: alpha/beta hydrolase [Alphaproteobacteria bacterium]|nr:alpha/beta hydrolase [Alphaproteobacteria bacterium]
MNSKLAARSPLAPVASDAAMPAIPESLRQLMAEIGPKWGTNTKGHIQLMIAEFSKLLKDQPTDGVTVERDIAYGNHERQNFDVYHQAQPSGQAVIFVHGGAFTEGHRTKTPEIYANACYYLARHGIVTVNMGYRLADSVTFPGVSEDIGSVVRWTRENAGKLGIGVDKLFLMGHSAGGAHIGSYAFDKRGQPSFGHGLAGLIMLSGRVRADNLPENPNAKRVEAYYGSDPAVLDDCSPINHVTKDALPTFIACGEFENPLIDVYSFELAHKLATLKRKAPPFLWMKGHNHTTTIAVLNTAEDELGSAIRSFIAETAP